MSTCRTVQPRSSPRRAGRRPDRRDAAAAHAVTRRTRLVSGAAPGRAAAWRRRGTAGARTASARAPAAPRLRRARCRGRRSGRGRRRRARRGPARRAGRRRRRAPASCSPSKRRRTPSAGAPPPGRVGEHPGRLVGVAGQRAGEHGRGAVGDEQGQPSAGAQHAGDGAERLGGVVDDLQHAVAEQQVGAGGGDDVAQVGQVALHGGDAAGELALGDPALQRGERVGAGVDDGDAVPGARRAGRRSRPCRRRRRRRPGRDRRRRPRRGRRTAPPTRRRCGPTGRARRSGGRRSERTRRGTGAQGRAAGSDGGTALLLPALPGPTGAGVEPSDAPLATTPGAAHAARRGGAARGGRRPARSDRDRGGRRGRRGDAGSRRRT